MSSMSGGRARSSWQRIRRDVAPSDLDGKRLVVKIRSSHAKSASQKPYSSSLGAGSQRRGFSRPARPVTGACRRSNWRSYAAAKRREEAKPLAQLDYFWRG
jgi:hypothetical protein